MWKFQFYAHTHLIIQLQISALRCFRGTRSFFLNGSKEFSNVYCQLIMEADELKWLLSGLMVVVDVLGWCGSCGFKEATHWNEILELLEIQRFWFSNQTTIYYYTSTNSNSKLSSTLAFKQQK